MSDHKSQEVHYVNSVVCPRCGCWVVFKFGCNCGCVDGACCENCKRYAAPLLADDAFAELGEFDVACTEGAVLHTHEPKVVG